MDHDLGAAGRMDERVSDGFADERIQEKIARLPEDRQREGLESLDRTLRERDVPPGVRLHLISAVSHLGRIASEGLEERRRQAGAR